MFVHRHFVASPLVVFVRCLFALGVSHLLPAAVSGEDSRPNILFCISYDQSWLHTGAMGDPVVKTPAFDRIATYIRSTSGGNVVLLRAFCLFLGGTG